jgi:hypothetical protein
VPPGAHGNADGHCVAFGDHSKARWRGARRTALVLAARSVVGDFSAGVPVYVQKWFQLRGVLRGHVCEGK